MTADNLKAAHEHDKKFSAWTLNTEDEIRSAIDLGADSYFTDDTGLAIKLEKEYRTE
jgi:glycerophosphoryl diester phosphodiesterase